MKHLQYWFNQIVGMAQVEDERQALAREIYGPRCFTEAHLALPACWRRPTRIIIGRYR